MPDQWKNFTRITLAQKSSLAVRENSVEAGEFFTCEAGQYESWHEYDFMYLAQRELATCVQPFVQSTDPKSIEYQFIEKFANRPDTGCVLGPQMLLFADDVFYTYQFTSKFQERQNRDVLSVLKPGDKVSLTSVYQTSDKFDFFYPNLGVYLD